MPSRQEQGPDRAGRPPDCPGSGLSQRTLAQSFGHRASSGWDSSIPGAQVSNLLPPSASKSIPAPGWPDGEGPGGWGGGSCAVCVSLTFTQWMCCPVVGLRCSNKKECLLPQFKKDAGTLGRCARFTLRLHLPDKVARSRQGGQLLRREKLRGQGSLRMPASALLAAVWRAPRAVLGT